jgi:hypothetical protein
MSYRPKIPFKFFIQDLNLGPPVPIVPIAIGRRSPGTITSKYLLTLLPFPTVAGKVKDQIPPSHSGPAKVEKFNQYNYKDRRFFIPKFYARPSLPALDKNKTHFDPAGSIIVRNQRSDKAKE